MTMNDIRGTSSLEPAEQAPFQLTSSVVEHAPLDGQLVTADHTPPHDAIATEVGMIDEVAIATEVDMIDEVAIATEVDMIDEVGTIDAIATELRAVEGFVKRHLTLVRRYAPWEVVFLVHTLVNTLTIGLIGTATGSPEATLFLVVGAIMWSFLSVVFHEVAEMISWERWEGTMEYTFMAPVSRRTHLSALCMSTIIYGSIRTAIVLASVALFFDLPLHQARGTTALVVLAASSLPFMGLGIVSATMPLLSPEKGPQAAHILQSAVLLVSGVYYEVTVLPSWLQPLSHLSPATYTLRAMRRAILEGAAVGDVAWDLLILVLGGLILIPAGLAIFGTAERYALRTGLLKRQG